MFFKRINESSKSSGLIDVSDKKIRKAYLAGIAIGIAIGMTISGLLH
jgi:hypothetical protein